MKTVAVSYFWTDWHCCYNIFCENWSCAAVPLWQLAMGGAIPQF